MIKKEVFIGLLVGLIANAIGVYLAAMALGNHQDIILALKNASAEGFLGKLVSLGAILNLITFFIFIKKKQDYRARGVLLATVIIAVSTFLFKFI
ncbi:hypothetical protein SAMN04487989_10145 [Bizionia echini]|uniref:Uncharacterized protein n=1 Tax=Bizionia echini TaxID=649333 RepID=A0A1I4YJQ4_9FLAO|nr:hypothetical protein [Bizionia echini]SFN38033.1 hypothetical protein SAMN04487989_10145 [Bizionia echini]